MADIEKKTRKPRQKKDESKPNKKEKKPIQVVAIITPDGIEGSFTPEPRRPLIVHFPFNSTEVEFNDKGFQYDPSPPPPVQPYDRDPNYFQVNTDESSDKDQIGVELDGWKMSLEEQIKKQPSVLESFGILSGSSAGTAGTAAPAPPAASPTAPTKSEEPKNYLQAVPQKIKLLQCYSVKSGEHFIPPSTTNVQCFWCSHAFDESPYFLPVKEENSVFHVYGNYCSPQCGLAYLLHEHLDSHVRWERMSLLHRMYKSSSRIYPAPPRESLSIYGGIYSVEEFRNLIAENRVRVDIQIPPMVSILGTLDTKPIDFYDSSLQNTFTQGFSMDRFKAWSEQGGALRLKRSKPLKDLESTLDACIQINIKRG
jgi:hypothetical protein